MSIDGPNKPVNTGLSLLNQMIDDLADGITEVEVGDYSKYREDPAGFFKDVLHADLWSKQHEVLNAINHQNARVSVRSCNGAGKTFLASGIVLWALYCFDPIKVITTATKEDQLKGQLWADIRAHHARSQLPGVPAMLGLHLGPDRFAIGQVAKDATGFHGYHCESILVIADEAAGISNEIFEGIDALLTSGDARLLMIGNPTTSSGRFYDSHHRLLDKYTTVHISAYHSPHFTGETVSSAVMKSVIQKKWVEDQIVAWGAESVEVRARIMGEFPDQGEGSLIAKSWVDRASVYNPEADPNDPVEMGVDVARQGSNESAVYIRQSQKILHFESWRESDLTVTAGRVKRLIEVFGANICRIDATGMGVGVFDILKEQKIKGVNLEDIYVGGKPNDGNHYVMLRDEIWCTLRDCLRDGMIGKLTDETTKAQLLAIQSTFDSRGRTIVEGKKDMEKRGNPSPDRADALALAFYSANVPRIYSSKVITTKVHPFAPQRKPTPTQHGDGFVLHIADSTPHMFDGDKIIPAPRPQRRYQKREWWRK